MAFGSIFEGVNINYPMITMNGAAKYRLNQKRYSDVHHIHKDSRILIDNALKECNMNAFVYTINDHILHAYHSTLKNDGELKFYSHRKNQNAYSFVKGVLPDDLNPSLYIIIDCKENIDRFVDYCSSLNIFEKVNYVIYTYRKDINGKEYFYLRIYNKSVSKEKYVMEAMKEKAFNKLIVSVSGRTDLELIKHSDLSMCLSIAPDYVKESVDIILNDDAGEALKIFDKIYHCTNIDKEI
jgi:hydroxymethylpyrimidine pyrophosphatase-like HAD family hydrolase